LNEQGAGFLLWETLVIIFALGLILALVIYNFLKVDQEVKVEDQISFTNERLIEYAKEIYKLQKDGKIKFLDLKENYQSCLGNELESFCFKPWVENVELLNKIKDRDFNFNKLDIWDTPFILKKGGCGHNKLISAGPDKKLNTDDDLWVFVKDKSCN